MNKFKKGDTVIFTTPDPISPKGYVSLHWGKSYCTLMKEYIIEDSEEGMIHIITNNGTKYWCDEDQFTLKSENMTTIKFDLEKAKAGRKVLYGNDLGHYKFTNNHPDGLRHIFQFKHDGCREYILSFMEGKWYYGMGNESLGRELQMEGVKREGWVNIYKNTFDMAANVSNAYLTETDAKNNVASTTLYITTVKITWDE